MYRPVIRKQRAEVISISSVVLLIVFLFLSILFSSAKTADGHVFRVLGVHGKIVLRYGKTIQALKPGMNIYNGQKVVVESGYCALIHPSGKTLDLKKPGVYPVAELVKLLKSVEGLKKNVSNKYYDYVMGMLSKAETDEIGSSIRKNMEISGAVTRNLPVNGSQPAFGIKYNVLPKKYPIIWQGLSTAGTYRLQLKNNFNEVVFSQETISNKTEIDFSGLSRLPDEDLSIYKLFISCTDTAWKGEMEFHVHTKTKPTLLKGLNPSNFMYNGMICEEAKFYLDAIEYYELASKAEPEVAAFNEALKNLRNKIKSN